MALPVVLTNSVSGSDAAASGAGPATALTGTAATTNAGGTVVTLDGSPDLTGVLADGSHACFLLDSTAGARNFGKITAVDNVAKTVTVSNAFRGSIPAGDSIDWAIGGKRASIGGTTSVKLFTNNLSVGDAMPGWIVEMESAHAETLTAALTFSRDGDVTDGPIALRGTSGAATRPILTFSNNGNGLVLANDFLVLQAFDLKNTNATKTASVAIAINGSTFGNRIENVKIADVTDNFWKAIVVAASNSTGLIHLCELGRTASDVVTLTTAAYTLLANYIHNGLAIGVSVPSGSAVLINNIIYNCTGDGVNRGITLATANVLIIDGNTIDDNGGDGIEIAGVPGVNMTGWQIINNQLTNSSAYGLNFSDAGSTAAALNALGMIVNANNTFGNVTAAYNPAGYGSGDSAVNPDYTDPAAGDWSLRADELRDIGYPAAINIGTVSATLSHLDPGAAQIDVATSLL